MKYMLQLYMNDTREQFEARSDEEKQEIYAGWAAIRSAPGVTPGDELADPATATTVRVSDGKVLSTDGPFAETKESLAGWFIVEAKDLDSVIELAANVPTARIGGAVEIRPIVER